MKIIQLQWIFLMNCIYSELQSGDAQVGIQQNDYVSKRLHDNDYMWTVVGCLKVK